MCVGCSNIAYYIVFTGTINMCAPGIGDVSVYAKVVTKPRMLLLDIIASRGIYPIFAYNYGL